ncbi:MAG: NAD(P)H-quinone oxidoreductase [Candidatus Velthaea sp.]
MRFVDHGSGGGPEVLALREAPRPQIPPGHVLVEVAYAGVNGPDIMQRKGLYPPPAGASTVLGLEVAGTIVDAAPDVTALRRGERVCALTAGGGYAEYAVVDATHCLPVPHGLSLEQAAALPETFFTVWTNVFERGRLTAGETLLVHGGSSGIGVAAIQLAKAFGARVFVTAGSAEKCAFCTSLGADAAIDYKTQDFVAEVNRLMDGAGVDVILDMVGGSYIEKNIGLLARDGRLVQIAVREGSSAAVNFANVMVKRLTLTGSTLRPQNPERKATIARALRERVWPLIENGTVKPVVHATFPLERAADAHRTMEDGRHMGKIMLEVKAPG